MAASGAREEWERVRRYENELTRKLRKIARHVGELAANFPDAGLDSFQAERLAKILERYGSTIEPWAQAEADRMVAEVARRDEKTWFRMSRRMARDLRNEISRAPIGQVLQQRSRECAELITSLPLVAAQRVREITLEMMVSGQRAADLVERIRATGEVTQSRAKLIARTEVVRTASMLTQARAESVGSTHYIWRTARDKAVRPSHRKMEGVVCQWANPPTLTDGTTTHAGQIYNCRCFPEPIIPDMEI